MKIAPALKRKLWIILVLSIFASLALELYTFGFPDGFFLRWLRTLFVFLVLLSLPVLGLIPMVNKLFARYFR